MRPMRRKLQRILLPLALLAASLALFEFTDLDLRLQDHFYDFAQQSWMVDKRAVLPRLLFYTGPKLLLIGLAAWLLLGLLLPRRICPRWLATPWPAPRVWLVILSLALVPATIAIMKSRSDIYTPASLTRYDGSKPYHHLFEPLLPGVLPNRGRSFPAGHASGGFALLSLFYLFSRRRWRWAGLGVGLLYGWTMGLYQMFKGAHFLSHTVVTMLLAWLIIEVLAMILRVTPSEMRKQTSPRASRDSQSTKPASS